MAKDAKKSNAPTKSKTPKTSSDDVDNLEHDEDAVTVEGVDDETETPPETLPPAEGAADEPVPPPAGSSAVIIDGEGTTPIIGAGGVVRTVERGVSVKVSAEELAYLKEAALPFKKG